MKSKTTFRELLKIPNIVLGNGCYKWRISDDIIIFEEIERGGKCAWHLDTLLDLSYGSYDEDSGISGMTVSFFDGCEWRHPKEDGMSIQIVRAVTEQDCLLARSGNEDRSR
jgi:hypothetical protein